MATPGLGGGLTGSATADLGLGDQLQQQVAGETDEERKKRMAALASSKQTGMGATPGQRMLFGATGGLGGIGTPGT